MRQLFSRLVVASGFLSLACATAMEDGPLAGDIGDEPGGSSQGGSLVTAGSSPGTAGTLPSAGTTTTSAGTTSTAGGKGGTGSTAFGGTATSAGKGGSGSGTGGGSSAGSSAGGKAGSSSGGTASGGTSSGGTSSGGNATAGTSSGGSGTAGATGTTCGNLANWTSKTYAIGDTVASVCTGVFAGSCPMGQSHKFECNPAVGAPALPWCQSREPGVGNGWGEAWVDKGACQ